MTALAYAIKKKNIDIVKYLLNKGANVNAKSNEEGFTPLMTATVLGSAEIVKLLLATKHIDINAKDKDGLTAMMYAKKTGYFEIASLLKRTGAKDGDLDH
jgi:ankyrin repeat protein